MRIFFLIFLIILSSCLMPIMTFAQDIAIWGSTTCNRTFLYPGKTSLEVATGIKTKLIGVGTGQGLIALIHGKADVSSASSNLESAIKSAQKQMKKSHIKIPIPRNLVFNLIHIDEIVPIINSLNPISSLSKKQLKDIHSGKISNWQQVGGENRPIQVVTSHSGSATRAVFTKQIMKGADYSSNTKEVSTTFEEIYIIANNLGAIGAVSSNFLNNENRRVKPIKTVEIKRPLGLITIGEPSNDVKKIINFYSRGNGKRFFSTNRKEE